MRPSVSDLCQKHMKDEETTRTFFDASFGDSMYLLGTQSLAYCRMVAEGGMVEVAMHSYQQRILEGLRERTSAVHERLLFSLSSRVSYSVAIIAQNKLRTSCDFISRVKNRRDVSRSR